MILPHARMAEYWAAASTLSLWACQLHGENSNVEAGQRTPSCGVASRVHSYGLGWSFGWWLLASYPEEHHQSSLTALPKA